MTRTGLFLLAMLSMFAALRAASAAGYEDRPPVPVDFFFESGCKSCDEIRREVLPELVRRCSGHYQLREWDIGETTNYLKLVAFQDRFRVRDNEPVSMVVDERIYLAGTVPIKSGLVSSVESAILRRGASSDYALSAPPASGSMELLSHRVAGFTLAGVVWVAMVDSVNPCAISTLVFFVSLLSVAKIGMRRILLAGIAFLFACFVTYFGIGFGLLRVLQCIAVWQGMRQAIDAVMIAVMMGFAYLSFRDAWRFHRSGLAEDLSLKLPASIQDRIHRVMKSGLRRRSLVLGGLGTGVAVTLLESVCTGQVYVPALVMMMKTGHSLVRCAAYLVLYNLIFVLPLAIVLALTCGGLGTPALVDWSRRNVAASKVLMGVFFLAMAAFALVL
jgi:hypothetical protein